MEKEKNLNAEWELLKEMAKVSPYVFRTRLERAINHALKYAQESKDVYLKELCENIKRKLNYISDQSNQTADGMLNSFMILQHDINSVSRQIKCI